MYAPRMRMPAIESRIMQRRQVRGRRFGCRNSIGFSWRFELRRIRLPSGYSDRPVDPRGTRADDAVPCVDMPEAGNRTYFGLSAGLAAALASALLFGATTPISKQLLRERRRPLQVVEHIHSRTRAVRHLS